MQLTCAPFFSSALTYSRPMPEAAPVTRAVFPLMNMSHFLKHGGKFNRSSPNRETSEGRKREFISNLLKYVI
jgi:hypothetical protein